MMFSGYKAYRADEAAQRLASAAILREDKKSIPPHVGHKDSFFEESAARFVERTSPFMEIPFGL